MTARPSEPLSEEKINELIWAFTDHERGRFNDTVAALRELLAARARIVALEEAAQRVIDNGPCSDPDCCATAIACADARERLLDVLGAASDRDGAEEEG